MAFKVEHYLDRVGLTDVSEGAGGLADVQSAHMHAIPFENIDPLLGTVPSLTLDDVVAKLVHGARGGYCFEHNALFGAALDALGYAPRAVLARVFSPGGRTGARSHHAFLVSADNETWICDTGFGGHGALLPLGVSTDAPQTTPNGTYRVRVDDMSGETALDRLSGDDWVPLYVFDTLPVHAVDFEAANYLCARWEAAPFSANLMLAFHTSQGRIALFNRALTRGLPPDARHDVLSDVAHLSAILRDTCGLSLDDATIARVWAKIEQAPMSR